MYSLIYVGIGGAIGAILRFALSAWVQDKVSGFPLGTLIVNFLGCLAFSIIMFTSQTKGFITDYTRLFLCVGMFGAFTTMSTFSYESIQLLDKKEFLKFGMNVFGGVAVMLGAVIAGKYLVMGFVE